MPPNWDRVFTNSVGYVTKLPLFRVEMWGKCGMDEAAYASIPPAVAPAIKEWNEFSLFAAMVVRGRDRRGLGTRDFPGVRPTGNAPQVRAGGRSGKFVPWDWNLWPC